MVCSHRWIWCISSLLHASILYGWSASNFYLCAYVQFYYDDVVVRRCTYSKPRFNDFSYMSDSTTCLHLIKSSSWEKSATGGLFTWDICVGILIVLELVCCLVATPHGLAFNSSGEKSRADVDCTVDNATTAAMIVAIRWFILGYRLGYVGGGGQGVLCIACVCLFTEMCLFDLWAHRRGEGSIGGNVNCLMGVVLVTDKSRAFVKLYSCFSTQVECKTNSQMSAINCCTFFTKKLR